MEVALSFLTLVLCLLNGGNDLLDYVGTQQYWQIKNVNVSVETMLAQLKPDEPRDISQQIAQLDADDPQARESAGQEIRKAGASALEPLLAASKSQRLETSRRAKQLIAQIHKDLKPIEVRRLMAIRTLGELGKKDALATLQPLLTSREAFVADYARTAIGLIDAKPVSRPRPIDDIRKDVWLLPADCHAVVQFALRDGKPVSLEKGMESIELPTGSDKKQIVDQVTRQILLVAEEIGNVRIESVTLGVSKDVSDKSLFIVAMARVQCDAEGLRGLARRNKVPLRTVDGIDVFEPNGEMAFLIPSDDRVIFIAAPQHETLPLQPMMAAIKTNKGGLGDVDAMKKLIAAADTDQVLWGVALMNDSYRTIPGLDAFDTLALVGKREGDELSLKLQGKGADPQKLKTSEQFIANGAQTGIKELKPMVKVSPILSAAIDLLSTVKTTASPGELHVTATVKASPAGLLSLPLIVEDLPARDEEPDDNPGPPR